MSSDLKKTLGYRLYGALYTIFRLLPVRKDRAYFIMTHDSGPEGNCGVMKAYMSERGYECLQLTRADTEKASFIAGSAKALATSRFVFADNAFLPLAFLKLRKGTSFIQLWHGTGTIKKFGQDVNTGRLKELEARCSRNITHLIVSSDSSKALYTQCFNVPGDRTEVLGLPRSDVFFDPDFPGEARRRFDAAFPAAAGRTLVLYAPTFRDESEGTAKQIGVINRLTEAFLAGLPDSFCLGLRLHPHIASCGGPEHTDSPRVIDLSHYDSLNTLLGATDVLITDYSSIIFEYSLLRRPMLFYAYDLADFETEGRGFYRDYRSYVPGPVYTSQDLIIEGIKNAVSAGDPDTAADGSIPLGGLAKPAWDTPRNSLDTFIADSFSCTDGHAADRLYALLTGEESSQ